MENAAPQQMELTLSSLGVTILSILPTNTPEAPSAEIIPPGTILLSTGYGDIARGERLLVHQLHEDALTCIDLVRHLSLSLSFNDARRNCLALLPPEPYPFRSFEEALDAVRKGLPLFAAPSQASPGHT